MTNGQDSLVRVSDSCLMYFVLNAGAYGHHCVDLGVSSNDKMMLWTTWKIVVAVNAVAEFVGVTVVVSVVTVIVEYFERLKPEILVLNLIKSISRGGNFLGLMMKLPGGLQNPASSKPFAL